MKELRNLRQIYDLAVDGFSTYNGRDLVLPQAFKDVVSEINNNTISYNMYSAIIETKGVQNGVLNIYLPNQWFYIASYFTDFYNELQYYKKIALAVLSKDRLKELNGKALTNEEETLVDKLPLSEVSKSYLTKFVTDYSWWGGAKTIDRGDFYVSPILSAAKLVNASQSFVADLCAFLSNRPDMVGLLVAAGNMNGARLKSPAPLLPEYEKAYRDAHERLTGFMRDFNGRKAHSQLWNPLSKRNAKERSVTGIPYAANLLSGSFENTLNSYKESGSFKNLSKK